MPRVSLVTPCFNGVPFLERYLTGLFAQTYRDTEVIFVNDGSTDDTERVFLAAEPELKRRFTGPVVYVKQENRGQCSAMNAGYSAATGDLLAPCDCDDLILPNKVADHVACFAENPNCSLVYGDYYLFDDAHDIAIGRGLSDWVAPPAGHAVYDALLRHGMFVKAGAYCFRRECLSLLPNGRLNESDPGQNLELLLRIAQAGMVAYHAKPVVKIYQRHGSHSRGRTITHLEQVLRSRQIARRIIDELGCALETRLAVERRYLGDEMLYRLMMDDTKGIRKAVFHGVHVRGLRKRDIVAYVASYSRALRRWFMRRYFPEWTGTLPSP